MDPLRSSYLLLSIRKAGHFFCGLNSTVAFMLFWNTLEIRGETVNGCQWWEIRILKSSSMFWVPPPEKCCITGCLLAAQHKGHLNCCNLLVCHGKLQYGTLILLLASVQINKCHLMQKFPANIQVSGTKQPLLLKRSLSDHHLFLQKCCYKTQCCACCPATEQH